MPEVTGSHGDTSPAWVDYEFRVLANPGTQLRSLTVRDTWGMPVEVEPELEPCTTDYYTCIARRVARNRYPLSVEVSDCDDNNYGRDEFPRFGVYPRYTEEPGIPFPCEVLLTFDNPPCEEAQRVARIQRNLASLSCSAVRRCREEFIRLTILAAALTVIYLALMLAAYGLISSGNWIAAIVGLFVLAAALVAIALAAMYAVKVIFKQREISTAEDRLRQLQTNFNEALVLVYDRCCPGDVWINTDMPCGERELLPRP